MTSAALRRLALPGTVLAFSGAPFLLAIPARIVGGAAFLPYLVFLNYYYWLPAAVFGPTMFPVEEFGYMPTRQGYVVAALLYACLGAALALIPRLRRERVDR